MWGEAAVRHINERMGNEFYHNILDRAAVYCCDGVSWLAIRLRLRLSRINYSRIDLVHTERPGRRGDEPSARYRAGYPVHASGSGAELNRKDAY